MERNVVTFRFGVEDLAATRFALWPTHELVRAVAVLQDPGRHPLQWGWLRRVRGTVPPAALRLLATVVPPTGYTPDILTPPPLALREPAAELALIREAPLADVARDLDKVRRRTHGPRRDAVARLAEDPEHARDLLADAARRLWDAVLAPWWPAMSALLAADIRARSQVLAQEGFAAMAGTLHERVTFADGVLRVRLTSWQEECEPAEGLVLVPSVLSWPGCSVMTDGLPHPVLTYPARGVGAGWTTAAPDRRAALTAVVGDGRARVLDAVTAPASTSQVAAATGLAVSTASEHLAALRAVGWVASERRGRRVEHVLTPAGEVATGSGA